MKVILKHGNVSLQAAPTTAAAGRSQKMNMGFLSVYMPQVVMCNEITTIELEISSNLQEFV